MIEKNSYASGGEVLKDVAQGIELAMNHCIEKYSGLVWTIAKRYVKNQSSAEDLVQEIFTELWKVADRFNPDISTECTFIGMLARRRSIDFVRKQSRQPQFESLPEVESMDHAIETPSIPISCEGEDIRSAIKELPPETQNIFYQYFDEGMTHSEIAQKSGFPLGTVKTRLRRGLIEVRNKLRHLDVVQPLTSAN